MKNTHTNNNIEALSDLNIIYGFITRANDEQFTEYKKRD